MSILRSLWADEAGFVVSAELVLVLTIGVLAMIVGLHAVAKAVTTELGDISQAISVLSQSFFYGGFVHDGHSAVAGAAFVDIPDTCDCVNIVQTPPPPKVQGQTGIGG